MDANSIFGFFEKLRVDSLSFLYHGFMSDEFTEKIISLSEKNIEKNNETKSVRNKVSFLIAESFQNIIRHGESYDKQNINFNKPGIFILRVVDETYIISSANLIINKNREKVESKLIQINSLDKDKLKDLYGEIIGNGEVSEKGGAGLGLIEMARKTGNALEYEFEKVDDEYSFFYLQMKFNPKSSDDENIQKYPIVVTKDFHEIMNQNNTYLTYKGDFSQENVLTLLKIIERNLQINQFENESLKTLIFLVLTELLQNISKHSFSLGNKKEGIFLLGKSINKYVLSTGNYIENNRVESFVEKIKALNSKSKEELHELYISKIKSGNVDDQGNAGIGFIEIAKECDKIKYNVSEINKEYSFLTISINI
jgi:hypothetical protein